MNIKDHGTWHRYTPNKLPKDAPANALFARRESDGADWYDYVNSGDNFAETSIKLTLRDGKIVGAAVTDPTLLFPGGGSVLEVFDVQVNDPQKTFGMKVYDAKNKTFSDAAPHDHPNPIADLVKRLEALEKQKGQD